MQSHQKRLKHGGQPAVLSAAPVLHGSAQTAAAAAASEYTQYRESMAAVYYWAASRAHSAKMWPAAASVAWSVCVFLSVGHNRKPRRNG